MAPCSRMTPATKSLMLLKERKVKIRNINETFGVEGEFDTVDEMFAAIVASGYEIPEDGLREGQDYEALE